MKQRKRIQKTKVNDSDAIMTDAEWNVWLNRVTSKPINRLGLQKNIKTNWIKKKDFNPKPLK